MTFTDTNGRVFLIDLDQRRVVSHWSYAGPDGSYADAAGVTFGEDFSLWIADTQNDVVRRFTAFGRPMGTIGRPAEGGVGAARRDRIGWLDRPRAVAVLGDVVLVAGGEGRIRRGVQRFRTDGESLPPLRAFSDVEGTFGAPSGIWADADGILVADTLHGVIQRFRPSGTYLGSIQMVCGHDQVARPIGVVCLQNGDVLVLAAGDHPGLERYRPHGQRVAALGDFDGRLRDALAMTSDASGRIYVLDAGGERVHRLRPDLGYEGIVFDLGETLHGHD